MKLLAIHKVFNYFNYFYTNKNALIDISKKYKDYMEDGLYRIAPNLIYKEDTIFSTELSNIFLKYIFNSKINICSDNKKFSATTVFLNAKRNPKFFDFSSNEVLTFDNKYDIKTLLRTYDIVGDFFDIPKIKLYTENFYIEEYIISNDSFDLDDLNEIYFKIYNFYMFQFIDVNKVKFDFYKILTRNLTNSNRDFLESIFRSLGFNCLYEFVINTHGDIHFGNLIKKDGSIYFLDWDGFGKYIFYYDYINILFNEALNDNKTYLYNYLNGGLDVHFQKLFSLFNKEFLLKNRKMYLQIYLLYRISLKDFIENDIKFNDIISSYSLLKDLIC